VRGHRDGHAPNVARPVTGDTIGRLAITRGLDFCCAISDLGPSRPFLLLLSRKATEIRESTHASSRISRRRSLVLLVRFIFTWVTRYFLILSQQREIRLKIFVVSCVVSEDMIHRVLCYRVKNIIATDCSHLKLFRKLFRFLEERMMGEWLKYCMILEIRGKLVVAVLILTNIRVNMTTLVNFRPQISLKASIYVYDDYFSN